MKSEQSHNDPTPPGGEKLENEANPERLEILEQLESGQIDVEEAMRQLEAAGGSGPEELPEQSSIPLSDDRTRELKRKKENVWLIFLAIGSGFTALGGWLGSLGEWWWLLGAPILLLGVVILVFTLAGRSSPWLHLKVITGQSSWPREIVLTFPLPLRWTGSLLRFWDGKINGLDATALDELLLSLEGNISSDTPIYIEVLEGGSGERIQVYLG
jgi:hypothetical protein